ncbi:nuclear pore complex protein NUP1-like [Rutidosis leptorrhynchoides]|uniref:nuclear pore complex protein NUP1-like n=1 Tax=Rutidosis leptorrhynchoides TaxID=125765 RepID=UPI003A98F7FB
MTTAGDGKTPYESGGAGGKIRKKPFRRNIPTKPYNRPPTALRINNNNSPSFLTKIVDPASRLLYAGAHKLFGVFRKRIPSLSLQGPPEVHDEPQNMPQEAVQSGTSAATGISDLEQLLQQKTFSRSEIQRLTALLHSKTSELPSDGVERNGAKPFSSPSSNLRLEASTSASLKKYGDERDNFHDAISSPIVSSKVFEETATPAELARSYMGSRPIKEAPLALRQDSTLGLPKTPNTSLARISANTFRGPENGFVTPRSRGRSAMYSMARTSYARSPSSSTQKASGSNHGRDTALTPYSAFGHERTMALKRRSSVLDDDLGTGGSLRRTRLKANLISQRDKKELGYTANQQLDSSSQKLLLTNGYEGNGDIMHDSAPRLGYGVVPTKSSQTATRILQHLETPTPKERHSGSSKSATKLTLDMLHGKALKSLEKVESPKLPSYPHDSHDDRQKSDVQSRHVLDKSQQLSSKGKEKVDENGTTQEFPIPPRNKLTSVNGDSPSPYTLQDNAPPIVRITDLPPKLPLEPPQTKCSFQMSAPEDSYEMDDEVYVNGHVSSSLVDHNKPETSSTANKPIIEIPVVQEGSKSSALVKNDTPVLSEVAKSPSMVENNKPVVPELAKIPEQTKLKNDEDNESSPKTDVGFNHDSASEQGFGFKMSTSSPITTTGQTSLFSQSTLQKETVASVKDSSFSSSSTITENSSPFVFSVNAPTEFKPNSNSDTKALDSTSVLTSVPKNDHVEDLSKKDQNGNDQKPAFIFGNTSSTPDFPAPTSTGSFLFSSSTKDSSTPNATPISSPPAFPSFSLSPPSNVTATSTSTPTVTSASTPAVASASTPPVTFTNTTSTTTGASSILSTSVPAPVFGFGSITAPSTTSGAETAKTNITNNMPNSITTSSTFSTSFATTTTTTGTSLSGFSSPAPASTAASNQSQGSFFNLANGSQSNTHTQTSTPVTKAVSFQFGSGSIVTPSSTSGNTTLFGSSAPVFGSSSSFGVSSVAASSETKSVSGSTNSLFGSTWQVPQSSGFGSTFSSSASTPTFSFGASSTPATSATASPVVFASTGASNGFFATVGATNSSFTTPSQSQPIFGNSTPVFGSATVSPNKNDQMSMEDTMAEDSMQSPAASPFGQTPAASPFGQSPAASPFGQSPAANPFGQTPAASPFGQPPAAAPGFMFGSATPTPTQPAAPYQFGGQPNQVPPQNPFQSSSAEFNGGGSFSLGSGGDKAGRRIVRVKKQNRRK